RRESRANRRGFPNDSRDRRITPVRGSASQYCRRSLPETSALLPTLTNVERPTARSRARFRIAIPSAPLCDEKATRPAGGTIGENDAFKLNAGLAFSRPMQLGPTIRRPWPRTL